MDGRDASSNRHRGQAAEALACRHLQAHGLVLVERNYRCRGGEIDLVMRDGDCLVFVEVRLRRSDRYGGGAESIDGRKQRRLILAASHYLQARRLWNHATRFDVVILSGADTAPGIQWIPGAFSA